MDKKVTLTAFRTFVRLQIVEVRNSYEVHHLENQIIFQKKKSK